ncbi:MAG: hypothetical protein LBR68_04440, partial [Lachnoclostridium sp.]|jgi:hypothetical protein|nr:hypothetical protein [Lachnoclostridium sp.]
MMIETNDKYMIGINTNFGDHHYYNWLYSNYIQIFFNEDRILKLVYYVGIQKDIIPSYTNQFLDVRIMEYDEIDNLKINIYEYINHMLECGIYTEIYLDEYYIPDRNAYQMVHYIHQNLVFGIEDEQLHIMGYSKKGRLITSCIEKRQFEKGRCNLPEERQQMIFYKYKRNNIPYPLDVTFIIDEIKDYLQSANSSIKMKNIYPQMKAVFGINVYHEILRNPEAFDQLMDDYRSTYLINEHKKTMKNRIEYLMKRGYIEKEMYESIRSKMNEIVNLSKALMIMVLKGKMTFRGQNDRSKCKEIVLSLIEKEAECYSELIESLQR